MKYALPLSGVLGILVAVAYGTGANACTGPLTFYNMEFAPLPDANTGGVYILDVLPKTFGDFGLGSVGLRTVIKPAHGGFTGVLGSEDRFGKAVANLGDVNGDGVSDLAVLARRAVWIVFLNADGAVLGQQKINTVPEYTDDATWEDSMQVAIDGADVTYWFMGDSLAPLGDLNGDGVPDLAIGVPDEGLGDIHTGAVHILYLNVDGTVKDHHRISQVEATFQGKSGGGMFGGSLAGLGDLDGDGTVELAVGAHFDGDGNSGGAVWILFLNPDGTVDRKQPIGATQGGFSGLLFDNDRFGASLALLGDLNGDGVPDLAVGAPGDDDGGSVAQDFITNPDDTVVGSGAVWILFLNVDGTVQAQQKISPLEGGFVAALHQTSEFATSIASLGDINADGIPDLAVSALRDQTGSEEGAGWLLYLNADGTLKDHIPIDDNWGMFDPGEHHLAIDPASLAGLADYNGDGVQDLAVGTAALDDESVAGRFPDCLFFGASFGFDGKLQITNFCKETFYLNSVTADEAPGLYDTGSDCRNCPQSLTIEPEETGVLKAWVEGEYTELYSWRMGSSVEQTRALNVSVDIDPGVGGCGPSGMTGCSMHPGTNPSPPPAALILLMGLFFVARWRLLRAGPSRT